MKKIIPYCVLSVMVAAVAIYAHIILALSFSSWQGLLALLLIAAPLAVYGWKQLALLSRKYPFAYLMCRFGIIVVALVYILVIVLKCVGVMK